MLQSSFTELFKLNGKKRTLTVYSNRPVTDLCGDKSLAQWHNEKVRIAIPLGDYDLAKGMLDSGVTRFSGNEYYMKEKLPGDSKRVNYVILERNLIDFVTLIDSAETYSLLHPMKGKEEKRVVKKEQKPSMSDTLYEVQTKWTTKKPSRFNRNRPNLGALL